MYHALLANRYLTSRVIPLVAVAAVGLCVALVIIVVSVMSGFLAKVQSSGRVLVGDVVITAPVRGIPAYEGLLDRLEADEMIVAACPVVDGWGLLEMPYPSNGPKDSKPVQYWGVDAERYTAVTGYGRSLWWRPPAEDEPPHADTDFRQTVEGLNDGSPSLAEYEAAGLALSEEAQPLGGTRPLPRAVLGIHVSDFNRRASDGTIMPVGEVNSRRAYFLPYPIVENTVRLITIPSDASGVSTPPSQTFTVANEFRSGIFLIDSRRVIVPIEVAQELIGATREEVSEVAYRLNERGEPMPVQATKVKPARATQILIRAADGLSPVDVRERVEAIYRDWAPTINNDPTFYRGTSAGAVGQEVLVQTWEEQQADFIGPIENERELMRTLFSLVYLVCAGLVLAIFWAIVYEKTRDIGILRAVGASRWGIAMIFLRYGLIIGLFGAIVGVGLAWVVVRNINHIHDALGDPPRWLAITFTVGAAASFVWLLLQVRRGSMLSIVLSVLGLVVFAALAALAFTINVRIWDPATYYFDRIPSQMDAFTVVTTMVGAILFSVLGAFFPAAKAADTDPVRALRYE
ncbi:MAG: ABC transporter permease [Phycisphaerales bacterium]